MAKKRHRPKFVSHAPGRKIKGQNLRKNPSFIGLVLVVAIFAFFYFGRDNLLNNNINVSGEFAVHFIDVGQGDCILIEHGGEFMLIDTGEDSKYNNLSEYLEQLGVQEFKYIILTHPHADHIGGAHNIVREYEIDKLIMPSMYHDTVTFKNLLNTMDEAGLAPTRAVAGDNYEFGEAEFLILGPMSEEYASENNYSVVILMQFGNTRFMFTGDMESLSESEIARHVQDNRLDISADLLKIAHHGSSSSSQDYFLDLIRPGIAVIQVGDGNSYGHPHRETLHRLESIHARILRNDLHGDIIIISDGRELSVYTSK